MAEKDDAPKAAAEPPEAADDEGTDDAVAGDQKAGDAATAEESTDAPEADDAEAENEAAEPDDEDDAEDSAEEEEDDDEYVDEDEFDDDEAEHADWYETGGDDGTAARPELPVRALPPLVPQPVPPLVPPAIPPIYRSRDFWIGILIGAVVAGVAVFALRGGGSNVSTSHQHTGPTTPTTASSVRPPQQVRVEVLNASGQQGAAAAKGFVLAGLGYQVVRVGNASDTASTTVICRVGFGAEAKVLARNVGAGVRVEPLAPSIPLDLAHVDCRVTLGSG
jgi:hypothetical protein